MEVMPTITVPIEMILAIFIYITPILSSEFRVNWLFGSGEQVENALSRKVAMAVILDFPLGLFKLILIYR